MSVNDLKVTNVWDKNAEASRHNVNGVQNALMIFKDGSDFIPKLFQTIKGSL